MHAGFWAGPRGGGCSGGAPAARGPPPTPPTSPPRSYVNAGELIEVTPTKLRLRKHILETGLRRQQRRRDEAA